MPQAAPAIAAFASAVWTASITVGAATITVGSVITQIAIAAGLTFLSSALIGEPGGRRASEDE